MCNDTTKIESDPCLHCGEETTQRAEGKPYCSMDCIGARRREKKKETIECAYPGCDWETSFLPGNGLSRTVAYREVEEHRNFHHEWGFLTELM